MVSNVKSLEQLQSWSVFPNPSEGLSQIQISLDNQIKDARIQLMDLQGRLIQGVFQGQLAVGEHQFELAIPKKGIYLLSIQSSQGINTQKVIRL